MPDAYKDQKGFGKELGKTLKLVAWCLHDWAEKHLGETMNAIAFDKLVEMTCRYWDILHARQLVSFASPFEQHFGIHGPGRTLRQNPKRLTDMFDEENKHPFMYSGRVVELFNGLLHGEHQLFKIEDPTGKREFSTGLTSAQIAFWEADEKFLTRKELGLLAQLRAALAKLSADQIRLLGTHTSAPDNERTLMKIVDRWNNAMQSANVSLSADQAALKEFASHLLTAVRNARELVRKSGENRTDYATARRNFLGALKNTDVEEHAVSEQAEAAAIWNVPSAEAWRSVGRLAFRFSKYVYACALRALELQGSLLDKNQKRDLAEGERCRKRLSTQIKIQTAATLPLIQAHTNAPKSEKLPDIDTVARSISDGNGIQWLADLQRHLCRDFPVLLGHADG